MINHEKLMELKNEYPVCSKIRLIHMSGKNDVPDGTLGTVMFVNENGQIHVAWQNGRSLAITIGIDEFEKVGK